jgi:hypothetical protein
MPGHRLTRNAFRGENEISFVYVDPYRRRIFLASQKPIPYQKPALLLHQRFKSSIPS